MNHNSKKINILFTGDIILGGDFIKYSRQHDLDLMHPFQILGKKIYSADVLVTNLEGPIYKGPNKRQDVSTVLSNHRDVLRLFDGPSVCVANLANNHIMDFGKDGLDNTIQILDQKKIYHVGAGSDNAEANSEIFLEHNGFRMVFLSFTSDQKFVGSVIAKDREPGCGNFINLNKIIEKINILKKDVDIICVILHWGHEYFQYPSFDQRKIAHSLVDAGANLIIGHHPHVVQGIEEYKNSLIFYSLGNFFFPPVRSIYGRPHFQKKMTKEFMLIKINMNDSLKFDYNIIGGVLRNDFILKPYKGTKEEKFKKKVEILSKPFNKDYKLFWLNYEKKRKKELKRESIIEVFKKLFSPELIIYIKTLSIADFKRNLIRIKNLFS